MKLELSEQAKEILKEKGRKLDEQIAREHNLTCADGYGQHDFNEDGVCYVCRYDRYEPKYNDHDRNSTYDEDRNEIDRWNDEAMSGGLCNDYEAYGVDDDY